MHIMKKLYEGNLCGGKKTGIQKWDDDSHSQPLGPRFKMMFFAAKMASERC